jgi:hypothetical protein
MKILLPFVRTCSRMGKITGLRKPESFHKILFFITGVISVIWFMVSKYLGGNTLVFLMDALWGTSEEHLPPARFRTAPFNNDWSSSIIASFDPVAIELVKSFHELASIRTNAFSHKIQLFPNPCNGLTNICFELDEAAKVTIEVYSSPGNRLLIKYLGRLNAGMYEVPVATNGFNPGVYFCKINIERNSIINTATKKLLVN